MKMNMKQWWEDSDGKTEVLGEKKNVSYGLARDQTPAPAVKGRHVNEPVKKG